MNRKGVAPIAVLAVVAVAAVVAVVTGAAAGLWALVTGPQNCMTAPFNFNCFCPDGYDKVSSPWIEGIPADWPVAKAYQCVEEGQQPSQSYAQQRLTELYPECDTIACEGTLNNQELNIEYGYGLEQNGREIVLAECKGTDPSGTSGTVWWAIYLYTDDGSVWDAVPTYPYCRSSDGTKYQ